MKERTAQDLAWNQQKDRSTELNKLLFTGFKDGHFWRSTITAKRALVSIIRHESTGNESSSMSL